MDEIKTAYRDLAQVWHPDRFAHDERLRRKAEQNLQRINQAYQVLEAMSPDQLAQVRPGLRESVSMMFGMGDLRPSGAEPSPPGTPRSPMVLGLGRFRPSTELKVRRVGGVSGWWWAIFLVIALGAVLLVR